jgi:non-canonical purine NTP pyrophosphatase, rdgB/HAM1 family
LQQTTPTSLQEISEILGDKIEVLSLKDIDCHDEIPETADTLLGNAVMKAEYIYNKYNIDCFADDTGLEVDSLNGEPGVYSARYANPNGHDSMANMQKLLHKLYGMENRKAHFKTVICLILNGKQHIFEGIIQGRIGKEMKGNNGFGYDPIFIPEGYDKCFAELPSNIKNKISHRAKAIEKLIKFIKG